MQGMMYGEMQAICRMMEVMGAYVPPCSNPAPGKGGWSDRTICTKPPERDKVDGPGRAADLGLNNPAGGLARVQEG